MTLSFALTSIAPCEGPADPLHGLRRGRDFRHGRSVSFDCYSGYQRIGAASMTCNDGKWDNRVPLCKGKKKNQSNGAYEPKAQTAGAYTSFISMKHLVVLLLPPPPLDGMLVHRRVTISGMLPVPIYTLGRQRETKKQRGKPGNSGKISNGTLPSKNFSEKK